MTLTRRMALGGLMAAGLVQGAGAAALDTAFRPRLRGAVRRPDPGTVAANILERSGLAGHTGFALIDLGTGELLEGHRAVAGMPPASVCKAATALYGLDALGPDYRFRTGVAVEGPVVNGRVEALYLIGGGDPHLDTDALADLVEQVAAAGIHGVNRGAYVVDGALPYHAQIDPDQPVFVGYNPSISGINLNFNRVHFDWKPAGPDLWSVKLSARTRKWDPEVRSVEMMIMERDGPVFEYRRAEGRDLWSVRADALGKGGARWLPVRTPALYAGEVFRIVANQFGLRLPDMEVVGAPPDALRLVASVESAAMAPMLRAMLKYSTNLTAEVIGLRASQARGGDVTDIAASGARMAGWLEERYGLRGGDFLNHSGLTDRTKVSALGMANVLAGASQGPLPLLMKEIPVSREGGGGVTGGRVAAKTGTLNFTRGLAGYVFGDNGRKLGFAILAADLEARRAAGHVERPRGSRSWAGRAKGQEQALLRHWIGAYCV